MTIRPLSELRLLAALLLWGTLWAGAASAAADPNAVLASHVREVFPGAERAGPVSGAPPAAPVYTDGALAGYAFFTHQVVRSAGYSGKPVDVLAGIALDGILTGARLVEHHEPILAIGVSEARLQSFIAQFRGLDVRRPVRLATLAQGDAARVDGIAGATVSSIVLSDAVMRSARAVARSRGILGAGAGAGAAAAATLDTEFHQPADWAALLADGSVARLTLANRDVAAAAAGAASPDRPQDVFIDLFAALATPAGIGRNLLGDRDYARLMNGLEAGDQALLIAANGLFSFKGTAFNRTGTFDRIQIVQGERTIRLGADRHRRLDKLPGAGAPELREIGLFTVPAASGFDALAPWRLELLVPAADGRFASFGLAMRLPDLYRRGAAPDSAAAAIEAPLWPEIWAQQSGRVAILALALVALVLILFLQDALVRRVRAYLALRLVFLSFTLVWLGWYAGAQLSTINILTFAQSLLTGFSWDFFLLNPLIFMLWSFVAVTLLFWGRGIYCGWLCPFGALQELLSRAARRLGVRQWRPPFLVHERLWPVKYVAFLGLFALSLHAIETAHAWVEIEPFKTAIILQFAREWPFVLYAAGLLAVGLFVERFFCRYLCPLGAALAIPARLRMFEWLKRKRQCGSECQICAVHCPVQAIHPDGRINPNECIYCLNCQTLYYDDHVCPPLIERRKRRESRPLPHAATIAPSGG
jgi:NosR/NirI family transcriptional regulator, nitrous oxide reductase regulator